MSVVTGVDDLTQYHIRPPADDRNDALRIETKQVVVMTARIPAWGKRSQLRERRFLACAERSEIARQAFDFPIAVAGRVKPAASANLGWRRRRSPASTLTRLRQGARRSRGGPVLH